MGVRQSVRRLGIMFIILVPILYYLLGYSSVKIKTPLNEGAGFVDVTVNFILPMRPETLQVRLTPEIPLTQVNYDIKWLSSTTVALQIRQKGYPQGQLIKFHIKGTSAVFPLINKIVKGEAHPRVPLQLLSAKPVEKVPSRGPVLIKFNTPVTQDFIKFVVLPVPGKLKPARLSANNISYLDFSTWTYTPSQPFKNNTYYQIVLTPAIRSTGGELLGKRQEINLITAPSLAVANSKPANGDKGVRLYSNLQFTLSQEVSKASVTVTDPDEKIIIPGEVKLLKTKVIFTPGRAFLPNKSYKVKLSAESKDKESLEHYEIDFTTVDMGEKYWVDVKLGSIHTVKVYKGTRLIRHMVASGGKGTTPTPTGYFVTQDRGYSFWSPRFGEGASYWVRLVGQILIHSVPRDSRWKVKDDEHAKLGLPASHGCIRLDEKDARWFHENIPKGTQVIIHQ